MPPSVVAYRPDAPVPVASFNPNFGFGWRSACRRQRSLVVLCTTNILLFSICFNVEFPTRRAVTTQISSRPLALVAAETCLRMIPTQSPAPSNGNSITKNERGYARCRPQYTGLNALRARNPMIIAASSNDRRSNMWDTVPWSIITTRSVVSMRSSRHTSSGTSARISAWRTHDRYRVPSADRQLLTAGKTMPLQRPKPTR